MHCGMICFVDGVLLQKNIVSQTSSTKMDEKLKQTMTLTVKRLDIYQKVTLRRQVTPPNLSSSFLFLGADGIVALVERTKFKLTRRHFL